ncbi:MAG: hypothetical protein HY515_02545 [Candidatus Aenigmarchaeota archaeon]|nr:hypothetical protein [Candidatus Aenigmarchaeota archaeon]
MMDPKQAAKVIMDLQPFIKKYGMWVVLALSPILLNIFFWRAFVVPIHQKLNLSRNAEILIRTKPEFESLIGESSRLLSDWERKGFGEQTAIGVVKELQKLAGDERVQIKEVRMNDNSQGAENVASGFTKTSVDLEVIGSYNKLARWLSAVENKPGVKIESWSMGRSNEPNQPCRLNLGIDVLLKNG